MICAAHCVEGMENLAVSIFDNLDKIQYGSFHLVDLITTELKSHMTCYNSLLKNTFDLSTR